MGGLWGLMVGSGGGEASVGASGGLWRCGRDSGSGDLGVGGGSGGGGGLSGLVGAVGLSGSLWGLVWDVEGSVGSRGLWG